MYHDPPTERLPRVAPATTPGPRPSPPLAPAARGASTGRRAVPWVVGVLGALVVVGSTFGSGDAPAADVATGATASTASAAAPEAPVPVLSADDQFIAAVESRGQVVTDEALMTSAGRGVCTAVEAGLSPVAVAVRIAADTQLTPRDAGYVVGAAVVAYCPEHRDQLPS